MKCPFCREELSEQRKWGDTGSIPDVHIFVTKCEHCGELLNDRDLIDKIIDEKIEVLAEKKKVHHSWPDSIDLVVSEMAFFGISGSLVKARVVSALSRLGLL